MSSRIEGASAVAAPGRGAGFARDLLTLLTGQFAAKLIGFFAFAYLARTLNPVGYGGIEIVVGLAGVFAQIIDCGFSTIGVRRATEHPTKRGALAAQVSITRLVVAVSCIPLMVVGSKVAGPGIPDVLIWCFAFSLLFYAWNQEWLLQSASLMNEVAIAQTLRMFVFAIVVVVLVHGKNDVGLVGWAEIVSLTLVVSYYLCIQHLKVAPVSIRPTERADRLLQEAVPVGLSSMVWSAAQYVPLFLVGALVGGVQTGWFAGANRLVASIAAFSYVYHFNLYPVLAQAAAKETATFTAILHASFRVMAWVGTAGALAVTLAAVPLLTTIFGAPFASAAPLLGIFIWIVPLMLFSGHSRWPLILANAQIRVLHAQIIGFIVVVATGIPLVMAWGGLGAALAAVAGAAAVWVASHLFAARECLHSPPMRIAAVPLTLAAVLWGLSCLSPLGSWANGAIALAVFAAVAPVLDRSLVPEAIRLVKMRSLR